MENAFVTIYIRNNSRNLLNLAINSSIGDLAALEVLVSSLMTKGEISTSMVWTPHLLLYPLLGSYNLA